MARTSAIDVDPTQFGLSASLDPLTDGFNSDVFSDWFKVIKVSREIGPDVVMHPLRELMQSEHRRAQRFLGEHVAETEFALARSICSPDQYRVVTIQEYVEGPTLRDFMQNPKADLSILVPFYGKCLQMYRATGISPDVANIQQGFRPWKNRNTVIGSDGEGGRLPVLVDTCSGKVQRLLGVWNWAIAKGVERAFDRAQEASQAANCGTCQTIEGNTA